MSHRLLVCAGNLDGCDRDGSIGPDHYRVVLWPGMPEPPRVVKAYEPALHMRRTPTMPLAWCMELAASTDRAARYHAIAELARHGTDEALARLEACARRGDALDRVLVVQALGLGDPVRLDRLEVFLDDPQPEVRFAVLSVLHHAMLDFEFDERAAATLDTDVAYRILHRASAGRDASVREGIAKLTSYLDGLVDLVPPAADAETIHARSLLARLCDEGLLAVDSDFDLEAAARAVAAAIDESEDDASTTAAAIADTVVDLPGVVELYADEDALARILDATS
ncbi:HEAT repeat domain-containing protein [Nannocystis exedens]|uniref:HEAT repeat domain-containing protein n=1 Tax=Nannocystis exedens TaxID=54 RepID=UPI0011605FB1|nr:HEAT repeat domain-containing protein [Nannocystis exedens]